MEDNPYFFLTELNGFFSQLSNVAVITLAVLYAPMLHIDGSHWLPLLMLLGVCTIIFYMGVKIKQKMNPKEVIMASFWQFIYETIGYMRTASTVLLINVANAALQSGINDQVSNFATLSIFAVIIMGLTAGKIFVQNLLKTPPKLKNITNINNDVISKYAHGVNHGA